MARPTYTEDEVNQTRDRILIAAMSLYLERGLESISLRQVADRLGLSHTMAYRYFDDKDALLAEMRIACLDELKSALQHGVAEAATPLDRLRAALATILTFGSDQPEKYRLVFAHEQPHLEKYPRLLALRTELFDACHGMVIATAEQQHVTVDPLLYTHGFWSLIHGMLSLHTAGQLVHGFDLNHLAVPLLEVLLKPLLGKASRSI